MELIIVGGEGLFRPSGRIAACLRDVHQVIALTAKDYALSATPGPGVGVILLGTELVQPVVLDDPAWELHDVRWGTDDNVVWIAAMPTRDPEETLTALADVVTEQSRAGRAALAEMGPMPDLQRMGGQQFAGKYLDPQLRVPAQTVAAGGFSFTPERMCWERQYTVAIVDFLAHGFDEWASTLT